MDSSSSKLWTFNFVSAWMANFLMGFSFYLLMPTLPFYLVDKFSASKDLIGVIMSCYVLAALLIRPFSGYIVDTFNRKPVYIISFVVFVALTAGYLVAATVTLMVILRFWHGISWGVITTAGNTLAIDIIPPDKRGSGIGFYGLSLSLSMAIGPMIGLFLYERFNFEQIFYVATIVGLIGLFFAILIQAPIKIHHHHQPISLDRFILLKGVTVGINLIFISFPYGVLLAFAAMYGKEMAVSHTGIFFTLLAIGMAFSRLFAGRMIDNGKLKVVAIFGGVILALGFGMLTLCTVPIFYFTSSFLMGLGYGILSPTFQTMFINLGNHQQRGTANSTFLTAFDFGVGGGMLLAGKIAAFFTLSTAFGVSTLACVISLIFFIFITSPYYARNKVSSL